MKNWRFRPITRFTAKTVQDTAIVTMEDEYKLVCDLSNGTIFSDLERPCVTSNIPVTFGYLIY